MKTNLLFLLLIFTNINLSANNSSSEVYSKIDSISKSNNQINNELRKEIAEIKKSIDYYELKESLFSNQLTILTTIFSTIVAIAIFLVGYLIPRLNNDKYKNEIKKLLTEFETLKREIEVAKNDTYKLELLNNYRNTRVMYFQCIGLKYEIGSFLWALRHILSTYQRFEANTNEKEMLALAKEAKKSLKKIPDPLELKKHIEEVNPMIDNIKKLSIENEIKTLLDEIYDEYNKLCWSTK